MKIEGFKRLHDLGGDDEITVPFLVGRNDGPWRIFSCTTFQDFFVCLLVITPFSPHFQIAWCDFPVFCRIFKARTKSLRLFRVGDVKEKFKDDDIVLGEVFFKGVDLLESGPPDFFRRELHDSHHENVFIVRPIENSNLAARRHGFVNSPEEIMR